MEALHSLSCRGRCASRVSLLFVLIKARIAAFRLRPAGTIPTKTGS